MMAGRIVTVLLFVCSSITVYLLDSAKNAFDIILQIGAGTGLLYLVRWYWWRVNAWCEIVAMASSFLTVGGAARSGQERHDLQYPCGAAHHGRGDDRVLAGDRVSRPADRSRGTDPLLHAGPSVRAGLVRRSDARPGCRQTAGSRLTIFRWRCLGWVVGCAAIWSGLFAIGNYLYGETGRCLLCLAVFVVSGLVLLQIVRNLWSDSREAAIAERSV